MGRGQNRSHLQEQSEAEAQAESAETSSEASMPEPSEAPTPKKRAVPDGHVRVRCKRGVMTTDSFHSEGSEIVVSIAEYERRESRGEFELID